MPDLSEGTYSAIGQTGDMAAISTPMDGEIAVLNKSIGDTLIAYGRKELRRTVYMKQAAAEASSEAAMADRLGFNSRNGKSVQGEAELVDAINHGKVKLEDVKK